MRQRRKRRFFTAAESADIWDRWRAVDGEPGDRAQRWLRSVPRRGLGSAGLASGSASEGV